MAQSPDEIIFNFIKAEFGSSEQFELVMSNRILDKVKDEETKKRLTIIITDWVKAMKEEKIRERENKLNSDFE